MGKIDYTAGQIENKLEELRQKWLKEPDRRKSIELQARVLKMALKFNHKKKT